MSRTTTFIVKWLGTAIAFTFVCLSTFKFLDAGAPFVPTVGVHGFALTVMLSTLYTSLQDYRD